MTRQAANLMAKVTRIDFADLDAARIDEWIAGFSESRRALDSFIDRLKATAAVRLTEPIELLHDAEIHRRQRDDWARGLEWLALHAEFSRSAKLQLGTDYVPVAADPDSIDGPSPEEEDLSLGDYLARAAQTGNTEAIDAFCRWSRTSVAPVKREEDWPTILLAYRAEFDALKEMAKEREIEPESFPRSETARKLLAELAACGFDETSVFTGAQRDARRPRRRLAELARVLVAKRYHTTPKAIAQKWKERVTR